MKLTFYCQSCSQKLNIGHSQTGTIVRCPACDMNQPVNAPLARRYPVMRITAVTLNVLGVVLMLALAVGVLAVTIHYQLWDGPQLWKALLVLAAGLPCAFAAGIMTCAAGETLRLLVEMEENTRSTRLHLEMMRAEQRPPAAVATEVPQQLTQ
ncbi:MAG: hypothetical protein HZC54_09765 [Verrucomicrobia bacterium]|nr:hypothetical protein [Verrucomicrobiota bacterium]